MGQRNCPSRFSSIEDLVILAQTDTTVGFVSQNKEKLNEIKSRPSSKQFLRTFNNFQTLKEHHIRIPNKRKNLLRRSKKTTFIIKEQAVRVASFTTSSQILRQLTWCYSTSANQSGKSFCREYCSAKADIIIEDKHGLFETNASKLLKINNKKIMRLR